MAAEGTCKIPIGLAAALLDTGVSPADALATARLPSRLLDIPGRYVPPPDYFALWRAIRSVSGDAGIGLRLATAVKPELTEPLFLAILSAADVAGALAVISRFKRLLEPQDLIIRAGHPGLLRARVSSGAARAARGRDSACRAGSPRRETPVRHRPVLAVGRPLPASIRSSPRPAAFFRCPIRLGAGQDAVVFTADDTGRPFLAHNPPL